ncbi:MAG: hemerythrin domain-containing protein [Alphaproteobacteria bacterium]
MYALKVQSDAPDTLFTRISHAPEAFRHPIAVIEADHVQQLALCDVLDRLLHNPRHGATAEEMAAVRDYLHHDLILHIADEEEDLFPIMRRHAAAGDDIEHIFELLQQEHQTDRCLNDELCGHVECLVSGHAFADPARFLMSVFTFAETQRRHLAWENTVVLKRARKYLSKTDQAELGQRMAKRRSIAVPD